MANFPKQHFLPPVLYSSFYHGEKSTELSGSKLKRGRKFLLRDNRVLKELLSNPVPRHTDQKSSHVGKYWKRKDRNLYELGQVDGSSHQLKLLLIIYQISTQTWRKPIVLVCVNILASTKQRIQGVKNP